MLSRLLLAQRPVAPRRCQSRPTAVAAAALAAMLAPWAVSAQSIYVETPEPGETFVNACFDLPLHAQPSAFSTVVAMAGMGDRLEVLGQTGRFVVAESMRQDDYDTSDPNTPYETSGDQGLREGDIRFAWTKVHFGGAAVYASSRCLVSPGFYRKQDPGNALRRLENSTVASTGKGFNLKPASGGAGKGFDVKPASGGAGKGINVQPAAGGAGESGKVVYRSADAIEQLQAQTEPNPKDAYEDFRRRGHLGEFRHGAGADHDGVSGVDG